MGKQYKDTDKTPKENADIDELNLFDMLDEEE